MSDTPRLRVYRPYVMGLDLGQAHDPTALSLIERVHGGSVKAPIQHHVRSLKRWPLWTPYPQIVEDLDRIVRRTVFRDPEYGDVESSLITAIAVDHTGVGRPVVDLMLRAGWPIRVVPVTITGGGHAHDTTDGWKIPKRDLIGILQVLLQAGRLKIAAAIPEAEALVNEIQSFNVKVSEDGNDTYGAASGAHDDLVLSLAMGVWWGEIGSPAVVEELPDPNFHAFSAEAKKYEYEKRRIKNRPGPPPNNGPLPEGVS